MDGDTSNINTLKAYRTPITSHNTNVTLIDSISLLKINKVKTHELTITDLYISNF